MMTIQEAINRGCNLLGTSIVALAGFAFLPEMFLETDLPDKIDDTLLFLLGLYAIGWYVRGTNRLRRTLAPVIFVIVALAIKMMGVMIEIGDKESVGDDFGGLILFAIATGLIIYQYRKTTKLLAHAQ